MNKRVAIYARVAVYAAEDQLLSQLETCRKYAQERGSVVVAEITDNGVSGATLDRLGLDYIRDLARAGEIDVVVVHEKSRLSRKPADRPIIEQKLGQVGVSAHYVLGYQDQCRKG